MRINRDYTYSKCIIIQNAAVVELVDTSDSKSDSRKGVTVQVRSAVPFKNLCLDQVVNISLFLYKTLCKQLRDMFLYYQRALRNQF